MFAGVGLLLAMSWTFTAIALIALVKAAFAPFDCVQRSPLVVAGVVLTVPAFGTIVAVWVESYGDRCIGGC